MKNKTMNEESDINPKQQLIIFKKYWAMAGDAQQIKKKKNSETEKGFLLGNWLPLYFSPSYLTSVLVSFILVSFIIVQEVSNIK